MSKIKNSTAVVKNCIDRGFCGFVNLANPHSNGDHLFWVCSEINATAFGAITSVSVSVTIIVTDVVVFIVSFLFVWKTNVIIFTIET